MEFGKQGKAAHELHQQAFGIEFVRRYGTAVVLQAQRGVEVEGDGVGVFWQLGAFGCAGFDFM
ncbi:MAG: hypothetical protein WBH99_03280 [Azovibrio sp.]